MALERKEDVERELRLIPAPGKVVPEEAGEGPMKRRNGI